jgi:hypothetical protein
MNLAFSKKGRLRYSIISLFLLIIILYFWQWLFQKRFNQNYILLCFDYGPSLLIFNAIITSIWSEFNEDRDLISANPLEFLASWLYVMSRIFTAFANSSRRPLLKDEYDQPKWDGLRDSISNFMVMIVVAILAIIWVFAAIPFIYFVFLISASPVRMALWQKDAVFTKHPEIGFKNRVTGNIEPINFIKKPVASAFALSSLVMLTIKLLIVD